MQSLFDFFISAAHADAPAAAGQQGSGLSFILMMAAFFIFIYFTVWRPQAKKAKEVRNLLSSLAKGDEVVTIGGMVGRISKISDHYLTLNVTNQTEIVLQKSAVATVLPKGTIKSIE